MKRPELIVMLTYNDYTIPNAVEIFAACRESPARYWGAKEEGIDREALKTLFAAIREAGKIAVLEVVAYEEEACIRGARLAVECGCHMLLGTKYFDSVNVLCRENGIRYLPFVGSVSGRPSVLEGSAGEMVAETQDYKAKGIFGVDLLGYRYAGDSSSLCAAVLADSALPVCLAGSINSMERLCAVRSMRPDFFTIGSAFLDRCFGDDISAQIAFVCDFIREEDKPC